ncbi:stearoyl-CoA desaturase (delta-9 desaturase) [Thiogranum longum]|uniref:Stearoyl-CoA desaturase (Delta-9 desaturase) n=1 Tax=Thiogranum longum TaxID=1537524 RepID=A0A4R1HIS9_9GAMM|nr:fatty acid desaturase [Thiogranum longum]TCK17112.1 stearoyl-CoA desaturase (delta-9 desaturase) [Thiogranum longum]
MVTLFSGFSWYAGLVDLPWWGYLLTGFVLTHITIVSVTVFLHRHQAHRALDLHPVISHFFRFWLWLTTATVTREWVAVHRKHHAKCETPEDPHSPQTRGIQTVLWRGAELYRAEADKADTLAKFGHATPDDWLERNLYSRFSMLGIAIMLAVDYVLFGFYGVALWGVQMLWIPFWAAGVINGIGHWWGYRNYETPDTSRNISWLGFLIGGEELHNNHHAFASSARFSLRRWEFDLGWGYIRLMQALGLARVKKLAPLPQIVPGKERVDLDTVKAVIVARFHVMSDYAREVLWPVLRQSCRNGECRHGLRRTRRLLVRDPDTMDAQSRGLLESVLCRFADLRIAYQYRQQLQQVWGRSAASHEALLKALQDWCQQAEATGVRALQEFAQRLKGYSLQPV